jgi:hypothetical protein
MLPSLLLLLACGGARPPAARSVGDAGSSASGTGIGARMDEVARALGPAVSGRAERALVAGDEAHLHTVLEAGRRYRVLAVGDEGAMLGLAVEDEHGQVIDAATGPASGGVSVTLAPRWTGPFLVRLRALGGGGPCGVQVFLEP